MALLDGAPLDPDAAPRYRPHPLDLHSIPDARLQIMRLLAERPGGQTLDQLLPRRPGSAEGGPETALRQRSAWTSTFVASLELAKQGEVGLDQGGTFAPIRVLPSACAPPLAEQSTQQV